MDSVLLLSLLNPMQLFLDTADRIQWQALLPTGIFYGVTTNPTLLERSQVHCSVECLRDLAQDAFALGAQEIHLQTWGTQTSALLYTGQQLAEIDDRVVVKVPITQVGCTAAAQLMAAGIRVTLTGVYAPHQALIAAALGADYAAPYLGRITDLGRDGRQDLVAMQQILDGVRSSTQLLVASIRSVADLMVLAPAGLHTYTINGAIATALFEVEATEEAATVFEQAAQRMGTKTPPASSDSHG